jgi:hypothetical protein
MCICLKIDLYIHINTVLKTMFYYRPIRTRRLYNPNEDPIDYHSCKFRLEYRPRILDGSSYVVVLHGEHH